MPINLNLGGRKATDAELQQDYEMAEQERLAAEAEQTAPEDVGNASDMLDAAVLGAQNAPKIPDAETNPAAFDFVKDNTGVEPVAEYGAPGTGPFADRIGVGRDTPQGEWAGNTVDAEQQQLMNESHQFQSDLQNLSKEEVAKKWRGGIQRENRKGFEFKGVGAALTGYETYSTKIDNNVQDLASSLTDNTTKKNAFIAKMSDAASNKDYKFTPESSAEYLNGIVTKFAQAKQQGVQRAFSDILLAAHLTAAKGAYSAKLEKEDLALKNDKLDFDEDAITHISSATDASSGRMINEAMGIKSTPESDIFAGALARKVVGDALNVEATLGKVEYAPNKHNPKIQDPVKGGLIAKSQRAVPVKKGELHGAYYNAQEITDRGIEAFRQMEGIIDLILPGTKKLPRNSVKVSHSKLTKARRGKGKKPGDWTQMNEYVDMLENTPASYDVDHDQQLSVGKFLFENEMNPELLAIGKFDLNDDGTIKSTQIKYAKNRDGTERHDNNGDRVPLLNPDGTPALEKNMGNETRKITLDANIEYLNTNGKKPVYFDYFVGGNNRVYVDASVGNWQNNKMVRALLQSAGKIKYNLNNKQEVDDLKAGIMKKIGEVGEIHYDKSGVVVGVAGFDKYATDWEALATKYETAANDADRKAAATELLKVARAGEGYAAVSGILEAVKLNRALKAYKDSKIGVAPGVAPNVTGTVYTSKFLSEIDGVSNGVAHSAFQGGETDRMVTTSTGLMRDKDISNLKELDDLKVKLIKEESLSGVDQDRKAELEEALRDAYEITRDGMVEALGNLKIEKGLGEFIAGSAIINRKGAKKPMMVFGYGASGKTIGKGAAEYARAWLNEKDHSGVKDALIKSPFTEKQFLKAFADAAVESVAQNFPNIKLVTETMGALVKAAAAMGTIETLEIPTEARHNIILGTREREAKQYGTRKTAPKIEYAKGTESAKRPNETVQLNPQQTVLNPYGMAGAKYKAEKQAGVLGIHAMDAINFMKSWSNMAKRLKPQRFSGPVGKPGKPIITKGKSVGEKVDTLPSPNAFQIFDGVMMPPKHAREWAKQLNDDFYELNKAYGLAESFAQHLRDQHVKFPVELENALSKIKRQREMFMRDLRRENFRQFLFDT